MNAWNDLKKVVILSSVRGQTPGSAGYQVKLIKASDIFISLRPYMTAKNREAADNAFDADKEVTEALISRGQLQALGLIK